MSCIKKFTLKINEMMLLSEKKMNIWINIKIKMKSEIIVVSHLFLDGMTLLCCLFFVVWLYASIYTAYYIYCNNLSIVVD